MFLNISIMYRVEEVYKPTTVKIESKEVETVVDVENNCSNASESKQIFFEAGFVVLIVAFILAFGYVFYADNIGL